MNTLRYRLKQFAVDHIDMIDGDLLSLNPNSINFLEQNPDRIVWYWLSSNPNAIHLLEQNPDRIDWYALSRNPGIFEIDYGFYTERCNVFKEELIQGVYLPRRVMYNLDEHNYDIHKEVYGYFDA